MATGGVSSLEGAGGGGLVPWALITGYGTREEIGMSAYHTRARSSGGYEMQSSGIGIGIYNRIELSISQQRFGLGNTVPGQAIKMDTFGAKVRLFGDAVYDQDRWWPQVAVGVQLKHNEDFDLVPKSLGAKHADGVDGYLSASKLYLDAIGGRNVLLDFTLQATKANQFGWLGFGGDKHNDYQLKPAMSAAIMLADNLLAGYEFRAKPDNLSVFREQNAQDVFVAWIPIKPLSVTTAYLNLGNIANKPNQTAWYLSAQLAF